MKPGPPPLAAMRPNAARLSRRTQRTTVQARSDKPSTAKVHEEYDAGEPQISEEHRVAQRIQRVTETGGVLAHAGLPECFYHKGHEGHNEHVAGAGRACAQGTRPARRPVGAWRASHATLWFWGIQRRQPPSYASYMSYWSYRVVLRGAGDTGAPLWATGEALCKAASAAKPNFQASKLPNFPFLPNFPGRVQDWRGFGIV